MLTLLLGCRAILGVPYVGHDVGARRGANVLTGCQVAVAESMRRGVLPLRRGRRLRSRTAIGGVSRDPLAPPARTVTSTGPQLVTECQQRRPVVCVELAEAYQYKFIFLRLRYYVIAARINRFTNCSPKLWRGPLLAYLT